jgi:hypothetical protein
VGEASLPAAFNAQLAGWLAVVNRRVRRALGCAQADRIATDRAAMLALPPGGSGDRMACLGPVGWDYYVRLGGGRSLAAT